MHPNLGSPAVVGYGLTVPYSRFEAIVGLIEPRCLNRGSAEFKVLVDGDTRFTSGILRFGQQESVSVPLQSAKRLTLEVSDGGDATSAIRPPGPNLGSSLAAPNQRMQATSAPGLDPAGLPAAGGHSMERRIVCGKRVACS
jgi:hypothetical protein